MQFPTTHWSEVARAADVRQDVKRAALGALLERYLPALRAHLVVQQHMSAIEAEDVLQGFVCDRVIADGLVAQVNRARGRFRTFLLSALDCYARHVWRHEQALKRRPLGGVLPVTGSEPIPAPRGDCADAFDVAWARQVLCAATERMRLHCEADPRRLKVWQAFEARVLAPLVADATPPSYDELRARFALESAAQVSNLVVTGKRTFARALWSVVGEYAGEEAEVEEEIRDLRSILVRAGRSADALPRVSGEQTVPV
jgi:RNA polymerase sigma-70 factor (ECF subfamily)